MKARRIAQLVLVGLLGAGSVHAVANPTHTALQGLSESARCAVLMQGISDCHSCTRTFFQGSHRDGTAFWNVECSSGKSYLVKIHPDGSSQLMDCARFKPPLRCFATLDEISRDLHPTPTPPLKELPPSMLRP